MELTNIKMKPSDKVVGGLLILAGLGLFGGVGVYVLPTLILAAKNTMIFAVELVGLAFLAMMLSDVSLWRTVFYGWKNVSRKIRKIFVSSDPIGTISTVISRFESRLEQIDEETNVSAAAVKKHNNTIIMAEREAEKEYNVSTNSQLSELERQQHQIAAGRWLAMAEELKPMSETLANGQLALQKAREMCVIKIEDLKSQKKVLSIRLDTAQTSSRAVKSIRRFFSNNPDLELLDMAVDQIEESSLLAEAELDSFMRTMGPVLRSNDIKASNEALQAVAKFQKFLLDPPKAPTLQLTGKVAEAVPVK